MAIGDQKSLSFSLSLLILLFPISLTVFQIQEGLKVILQMKSFLKMNNINQFYHSLTDLAICSFALFAGISSIMISYLVVFINKNTLKLVKVYLQINYLVFGPYLFSFCCLAVFNWKYTIYYYSENLEINQISYGNLIGIIIGTIFSCFLIAICSISNLLKFVFEANTSNSFSSYYISKIIQQTHVKQGSKDNEFSIKYKLTTK